MGEVRYIFVADWRDTVSGMQRKFNLSFFPRDNSVEMFDLMSHKIFLKRLPVDTVSERDFYVGNTVVILARQLKITDYGDAITRDALGSKRQKTFAMVKPDAMDRLGEVINLIQNRGFEITRMRMVRLTRDQAGQFYEEHRGRNFYENLLTYIAGGPIVAMELTTLNAVKKWRETLGPTDSVVAVQESPDSVRAKFGTDKTANAAHGSDSDVSAVRELEFFFPSSKEMQQKLVLKSTAQLAGNNTCAVVKPHAIAKGHLGNIISAIKSGGFQVTALEMFRLDKTQAEEFFEVYKGVVNEYPGMIQQLISGPCVAMEICSSHGGETAAKFRELVGPSDPEVARELRAYSIRAKFGEDKVKNSIHCSDLPDDGPLEFKLS